MQLLIYDIDGTIYLRRNLKTKYYFINLSICVTFYTGSNSGPEKFINL